MILITRYIDVDVKLNKIIPIEESKDLNDAIEKAKEIFYDKELSNEYLNNREVSFKENLSLRDMALISANTVYQKYQHDVTYEQVQNEIYSAFKNEYDYSKYLVDETIKVLEQDYNMSFEKINI